MQHTRTPFRQRLFVLVFSISAVRALGVTYYVSPNGNDANSGTSQAQAWRTIARVVQSVYSLQPGDAIRFQRGGVYRGELIIPVSGTSGQRITVGAYGSGADPVISGSEPITGWTQHQGHVWRANASGTVRHVYVNGQLMTLARFPNTGWLRNDQGSNAHITDAELTQPNGYWTGATAVIRSTNWSFDAVTITSHTGSTITFPSLWYNLGDHHWGYFLCNKLSELDAPGEWFHDAANGHLYLWAPGNANPNGLLVEAAVHERGVNVHWQRQYITIEDIAFRHQRTAGIRMDGANQVVVSGCGFSDLYVGISNYGNNNTVQNCTFLRTHGTAVNMVGDGLTVQDNTLNDIAMAPGLGENNWGYFGIVLGGTNNIIRRNRLDRIGYIGVVADKNCLIERNVVNDATALLNDGGGIAFDHADGMIVQDNIVTNIRGDLESSAPNFENYEKIAIGIYFGNTSIRNTIVRRNTVAHCSGAGIHVDHTMVSSGNQIVDNTAFNNAVQLTVSDYSNYNGPGATPPYHVPQFNGVYTGNILYSLSKDQLCMLQYNVHSPNPVDFGTFANNRYFNPYDELSIVVHNTNSGVQRRYTLERWQTERNEDQGSTRSPLRLNDLAITETHGGNLIANGDFNVNINGWGGWPTQAQLTRDLTYLDNGALRVHFANNASYNTFFLYPDNMATMQNGQFYRLSFSLQSNMSGTLQVQAKGQSQVSGPQTMYDRPVPFSPERRDLTLIFQSDRSEPVRVQFINHYTESTYWLDNVVLQRVSVTPLDPMDRHALLINDTTAPQEFTLTGCWSDVNGALYQGTITVPPFGSKVLIKEDDATCGLTTGVQGIATATRGLAIHPNPAKAGQRLQLAEPLKTDADLVIADARGRAVHSGRLPMGTSWLTLDEGLVNGLYLLALHANGSVETARLIIE